MCGCYGHSPITFGAVSCGSGVEVCCSSGVAKFKLPFTNVHPLKAMLTQQPPLTLVIFCLLLCQAVDQLRQTHAAQLANLRREHDEVLAQQRRRGDAQVTKTLREVEVERDAWRRKAEMKSVSTVLDPGCW